MITKLGKVLTSLGAQRSGFLLLAAALVLGWLSKGVTSQYLGGLGTHSERILALENWTDSYADLVEDPLILRVGVLEETSLERTELLESIEEMVYALFCDRWAEDCISEPIREDNGGTQ